LLFTITMPSKYRSISAQVADILREKMRKETWRNILPGERQLAERLGVSRKTVRKALVILRGEGSVHTLDNRVNTPVPRKLHIRAGAGPVKRIALLLPESIETARTFTVLWINRLMALAHDAGFEMEVMAGWRYFGRQVGQSLRRLVDTHPGRCWILSRSHRPLQEWFAGSGELALVSGTALAGVSLPSVDVDHHALCHEAAREFLRRGHRRLALFLEKTEHGGEVACERGFRAALSACGDAGPLVVCRPSRSTAAIIRELARILGMKSPPTGVLLSNPLSYVTAFSYLASRGLRVPRDVSIASRSDEPFLGYLYPPPARHFVSAAKLGATLFEAVLRLTRDPAAGAFKVRITPDLIRGSSIGPPRS
jgi:DNA-binding LacI/PurR family transcriptional regulator